MSRSIAMATLIAGVFLASYAHGETEFEARNWCSEARLALTNKDGSAISCATVSKRCVRMNNYWCQKHGGDAWKGTPKADGKDGRQDTEGHAVFASPKWSARAIAIDLRSKYRKGLVTAADIAAVYSPWCDTLGSKAVVQGHGRTCADGRAKPPVGFTGPLCKKPNAGNVSTAHCAAGCNCPPEVANALVQGLDIGINDDLLLFDQAGVPGPRLARVLQNLAVQEQGIYVKPSAIEAGLALLAK